MRLKILKKFTQASTQKQERQFINKIIYVRPKYAKQLDSNIKELIANGGSNEDIDKMASDYTSMFSDEALKKKKNPMLLLKIKN